MSENVTDAVTEFSTIVINDDERPEVAGELKYIIVPLVVIAVVMFLSALVYMMARKRKLDTLRHRLMPLYNFDKTEHESDWETEFLNGIDNPNYSNYSTTKFNSYDD